ncbi:glucose-6-phosphate isomerase [Candidatus Micrarchaeota archaeon]|nr:glucose-6-phosphate isomerase [Candidatus Micrarchaeota archaeon]
MRKMEKIKLNTQPLDLAFHQKKLFSGGSEIKGTARLLEELREVVHDSEFYSKSNKKLELYFMFRNLYPALNKYDLNYDITILSPTPMGKEFNKTLGHYHAQATPKLTYPEIYEVLHGEAHYLIQKLENGKIVDVLLIKARKGDKVFVPPNYGHVTINPKNDFLVMANLVSNRLPSIYAPYKENKGGAYYELDNNELIPNKVYGILPQIKVLNAPKCKLSDNLCNACAENPEIFAFLNNPNIQNELF